MRTDTENFISEIILSPTYNNQTSGDVESPTGYFGYMSFSPNEFVIDGMDTPSEFLGRTVIAVVDSNGFIDYTVFAKDELALAESWFDSQVELYGTWL